MPNRIIKESIWTSRSLSRLSPRAELHFYRLLPAPDDYGCFESTASVIRGRCYPLNESVRSTDVEKWQDELDQCDLIVRWLQNNRQYAIFPTWAKHQYVRNAPHQRRTPEPPPAVIERVNRILSESGGELPQVTASDGLNLNLKQNPEQNPNQCERENSKEKKFEVRPGVFLTHGECERLIEQFGEDGANERIENLSLGIQAKGYKYKSHYHAILSWERHPKGNGHGVPGAHDPDKYVKGRLGHMVRR